MHIEFVISGYDTDTAIRDELEVGEKPVGASSARSICIATAIELSARRRKLSQARGCLIFMFQLL